ncbi:hypothetical protein ACTFIR_002868 [Dictyostelium discoideum]
MSTTVNNNDASSSSTSASNNAESFDLRMKSMEDQINNLSLAFTRFMKEPMFSSNTNSRGQRTHDDSDTENEQSDYESSNNVDVPTEYQLSDTLLGQYKHMVNNQGLLVEELNVAPFGTPEGITVSSTVKNNDTDLLIVERKQDNQDLVIPVVNNSIEHVIKSSRNACAVNGVSSTMSETEQLQAEDSNRQHNHSLIHQPSGWSDTGPISSVRTTLETMPQEESELDWRAYSRILQCKSRPPQPSFRDESQIIVQSYQELQLATEEGSVQC